MSHKEQIKQLLNLKMDTTGNTKQISDYLHLYLPCPVELDNGGSKIYSRIAVACGNMDDRFRYVTLREGNGKNSFIHTVLFSENRVKPILRPLSDMTEEEINIRMMLANKWSPFNNDIMCSAEQVNYLLKSGFDLFGLIEAGLAIDLTKLNK